MPNDENLVATVHYFRDYTYSGSTVGNYSYRYSYQYDSEGNVSRLKIEHDTYDYFYITPTYDGLNRLSAKTVMLRGSSSSTGDGSVCDPSSRINSSFVLTNPSLDATMKRVMSYAKTGTKEK